MDADATLIAVAAGRAATVAQLRALADRLDGLALPDAAEVRMAARCGPRCRRTLP